MRRKKKSIHREWLRACLFALVIVLFIRSFLFEAFTIPTPSMEKSLLTGDFVLVSKLSYGPRLPNTLLTIPFFHQYLFSDVPSFLDWINLPYYRLPGFSDVQRNDIVVFNYPMDDEHPVDKRTYFIKRCVGLPGDTFEVRESQVYINSQKQGSIPGLQYNYHVKSDKKGIDSTLLEKFNITEGGKVSDNNDYLLTMTQNEEEKLSKEKGIQSIKRIMDKKNSFSDGLFPMHEQFQWNMDYFGPLYIPKKGDTIPMNRKNSCLYLRILTVYEGNTMEIRKDSVFINNAYAKNYVCKMNYYITLGDNRNNSTDSRYWGFVPEDHIVGRALYVLFSFDKNKGSVRWNRCLSKVI